MGVTVGVLVAVGVSVIVGVLVGVFVGVIVGVWVGKGVGADVGVAVASNCLTGPHAGRMMAKMIRNNACLFIGALLIYLWYLRHSIPFTQALASSR